MLRRSGRSVKEGPRKVDMRRDGSRASLDPPLGGGRCRHKRWRGGTLSRPRSFDPDRTVAVILARGGCQGFPKKNLRTLAGVPLLGRAVETLRGVPAIARVVVSTDDAEVASLALAYGAEIPFLRPVELAGNLTTALPALCHAVEELVEAGERGGTVLLFQATSPCCTSGLISAALEAFRESEAASLRSVTAVREHPHWMGRIEDNRFRYLVSVGERAGIRNQLPPLYRLNGAISIYRTARILAGNSEEGDPIPFVMDRTHSLDLDDLDDWMSAESILEARDGEHEPHEEPNDVPAH